MSEPPLMYRKRFRMLSESKARLGDEERVNPSLVMAPVQAKNLGLPVGGIGGSGPPLPPIPSLKFSLWKHLAEIDAGGSFIFEFESVL